MDIQLILVVISFVLAVLFLVRKFMIPTKKNTSCNDNDCGCH